MTGEGNSPAEPSIDDLVQPVDDVSKFFGRSAAELRPDSFGGKGANLTDLDPRSLRQPRRLKLVSQWKTGALGLTAQGYRDHGSGTLVEDVVAEHKYRTQTRLFVPPDRIQIRPANLPPQYSGHVSRSRPKPSSASAFSNFGSSLAHSEASRLRSIRASFSATASWIARLRLGNTFLETKPSTLCNVCRSRVIATFTLPMRILLGMTIYHTPFPPYLINAVQIDPRTLGRQTNSSGFPLAGGCGGLENPCACGASAL